MAPSQFDQFLQEATYHDPESDQALDRDALYGLYTSWCYVTQTLQEPEHIFWAAMTKHLSPGQGLRMKGPAALDYIVTSYPAMV